MNKLYNKEMDIAIGLNDFFSQIDFKFSKPQLKVLPHLIMAAINAENITNLDLAKNYIDDSLLTNHSSIEKKIWRFLNNNKFDGIKFFKAVVKKIIKKIGALKHNKLVVILDHMYTNDDFVTLMFTLKIGKQSIPIHFINDKDKRSGHYDINDDDRKFLFSQKVIIEAIDYVIDLLSCINAPITFLGDRWFCNLALMRHIHKKGHFFCIRAKVNSDLKVLIYDKKEKHYICKKLSELTVQKYHALYYKNISVGKHHFKCNLSIGRGNQSDDPWFILSNIEPNQAIREYSHRFGGIEMFFKSQKSNGFNLEKTRTRNLHAFENLYSIICFAGLWLSILAIDYTKNYAHVKKYLNIRYVKNNKNGKPIRILSIFNLGLTIFRRCFNSYINYKIKTNMQLYL